MVWDSSNIVKVTVKGKGEMVTFWVEDKANRTPPMEDELKVLNLPKGIWEFSRILLKAYLSTRRWLKRWQQRRKLTPLVGRNHQKLKDKLDDGEEKIKDQRNNGTMEQGKIKEQWKSFNGRAVDMTRS